MDGMECPGGPTEWECPDCGLESGIWNSHCGVLILMTDTTQGQAEAVKETVVEEAP